MRISVVITTRNRAAFLEQCLDSVFAQTRPADEVIVHDAASTDATAAVLERYAAAHPCLKYDSAPDAGEYDGLNIATARTTGDALKWLADDDLLPPGALAAAAAALQAQPGAGVVFGLARYFRSSEAGDEELGTGGTPMAPFTVDNLLRHSVGHCSPACVVRRSVWQQLGGFSTSYVCGDTDFWVRCAAAGVPFGFVPELLYAYRWHDSNTTKTAMAKIGSDIIALARKHGSFELHQQVATQFAGLAAGTQRWQLP